MNGLGARPAGRPVRHARPHQACRRPPCPRSGRRGVRRRITRVLPARRLSAALPVRVPAADPRSRPPRPAGPWRGRRSQARRVDRQRARRPLGAGGRPLGRGELVRRLMPELGLAPCLPWPRRFNLTQAAAGRVPDLVGRNFTADAPGKSSSMTLPISPPGRPAVSRNGLSTAARWKSSVTRWTTTTETRSPTLPPHFADGISVAHVHPTSTSPTRLFEREGGRQAVVAGEYHPLNGEASESSSGCFGQDSKGIVP